MLPKEAQPSKQASIPREKMRSSAAAREVQQPLRKVGRSRRRRTRRGRPTWTRPTTDGIVRPGRSSRASREQKAVASSVDGRTDQIVRPQSSGG